MSSGGVLTAFVALGLVAFYLVERQKRKQEDLARENVLTDIAKLRVIIEKYRDYYGRYSIVNSESDEQSGLCLLEILVGKKFPWGELYNESVARFNPDGINFAESLVGRRTINGQIVDPWDNPYNICIDRNEDGVVEFDRHCLEREDGPLIEHYHVRIGAPIAIWSNGPNKRNDLGLGDDIKSWW